VLNRFGDAGRKCAANPGLTPSFRRSLPRRWARFEDGVGGVFPRELVEGVITDEIVPLAIG
jgi:hypothetical protein